MNCALRMKGLAAGYYNRVRAKPAHNASLCDAIHGAKREIMAKPTHDGNAVNSFEHRLDKFRFAVEVEDHK